MDNKELFTRMLIDARMARAATMQALRDLSESLSEDERLTMWDRIERLDDRIEALEKLLKEM